MRTTRIKIAVLLLAAVLATCALTGCNKSGNKGTDEMSVKTLPFKTEYYVGDTVDLTGGVLLDGTTEILMTAEGVTAEYSLDRASMSSPVVLSYGGKTATFNVVVIGITSISVAMPPEQPAVVLGGQASLAGGTLTVKYEDGTVQEVPMVSDNVAFSGFSSEIISNGVRVNINYFGEETYCYFGVVDPIDPTDSEELMALFDKALDYFFALVDDPESVEPDEIMYYYYSYLSIKGKFTETETDQSLINQLLAFMLDYWIYTAFDLINEYSPEVSLASIERTAYMYREMYCRTVPPDIIAKSDEFLMMTVFLENAVNNFEFQAELAAYMNAPDPSATAAFVQAALEGALNGDTIGFADLYWYYSGNECMANLADALHPGWGEVIEEYIDLRDKENVNTATVEAYEDLCVVLKDAPQIVIDVLLSKGYIEFENVYLDFKINNGAGILEDLRDALLKVEGIFKLKAEEVDAEAALEDVAALKQVYDALSDDYKRNLLFFNKYIPTMRNMLQAIGVFYSEPDYSGLSFDELISAGRMMLAMST